MRGGWRLHHPLLRVVLLVGPLELGDCLALLLVVLVLLLNHLILDRHARLRCVPRELQLRRVNWLLWLRGGWGRGRRCLLLIPLRVARLEVLLEADLLGGVAGRACCTQVRLRVIHSLELLLGLGGSLDAIEQFLTV